MRTQACNGKRPLLQSPRTEKCPSRLLPVQQLDDLVWADRGFGAASPGTSPTRVAAGTGRPLVTGSNCKLVERICAKRASGGTHQLERLTEGYLAGVVPLEEYKRRRYELEQRLESLAAQVRQLEASATRHVELAGIAQSMEAFCQRVSCGLEQASFEQKRQLIELLIDRVVVTNEEVEIRYVIPTSPSSEQARFCHLRSNYFQAQGQKPIPKDIFLRWPAARVGLH
jgi:site-specific DNA recombinase